MSEGLARAEEDGKAGATAGLAPAGAGAHLRRSLSGVEHWTRRAEPRLRPCAL